MLLAITLPLVGLLLGLPGLPGLSLPGVKDLKKLRQGKAAPLDSLPPAWRSASRLGLENQFVLAGLRPLGPTPTALKLNQDPRQLRVGFDPDSGAVRYVTEFNDVTVGDPARLPLQLFAHDLTRRNFKRLWDDRTRAFIQSGGGTPYQAAQSGLGTGLKFELPSPLPKRFQGLLGPGGPSLTVSGSENIRLSGTSNWTNQQVGLLGQRRSLFPSLDMQQDLDIRLDGRLSDRVGVNLLQNSANQIPLANRIAINYKGDEDDMVQALDLGNTNLSLPGTQYVSYSGKNEGLFGMKATTRLGPLDFTVLASKQEGRSERASYAGGSSKQIPPPIADKDYVRGVYYFLYDPNLGEVQDIDETSITLYLDEGANLSQVNRVRGRVFVDPVTACVDPLLCPDGPDPGTAPDTSAWIRGTFRQLKLGADQDFEILSDVYGPLFKVIRLRAALTGESQCLAVTYRYRRVLNNAAVGDSIRVGGTSVTDYDGEPAVVMKMLRAPLKEMPPDPQTGLYSLGSPFYPTRELELKNFYQLSGQRIDPKTFVLAIRQGNEVPAVTTVKGPNGEPVPYVEVLGLDNFDETNGFTDYNQRGHDGFVDGTGPNATFRAFVDFDRGTLFFPDPRPFAPRLASDTSGRAFDRYISTILSRRDSLVGGPGVLNQANPDIYDKRTLLSSDALYYIETQFTAARAGNEIVLGRSNIIEGSDVVKINGQPLQREKDYRIDYDLGRVTLIRQLGPSDQLDIDYSYAPLFQQAGRTLIGNAFRWEGRDRSFGGAFLYESRGAQDLRPRLGEEPSQALIGDINTDWRFKPSWMTRLADRLPGVRTSQPSEMNFQAEVGASLPNPNTRNEIFIDDMEGARDAVSLSMGPERWQWSSVPLRTQAQTIDDPSLPNPQKNAEIHWYSPLNMVKERELKPSLNQAQGAQNTHQSLAISLPRRPVTVTDPNQRLWAGLTYPLDPVGIDLSRAQFLEVWVNDFRDRHNLILQDRVRGRGVKLHVDLGVVAEDEQRAPDVTPNNRLDSEDKVPRDNQLTVTEGNNEDTGLDNQLDAGEVVPSPRDLVTANPGDPEGDNFALPNSNFKDWDPRKWLSTNGTEDNKNIKPVPDTEDLNLNNALDTQNSYFEYTIDLGDSASRYLVTDVHDSYAAYTYPSEPMNGDNGWRRYRIPIADSLRVQFGLPDLTLSRHVRVWLEDVLETDPPPLSADDGRPFLVLGGLEIVGSRWLAGSLDAASDSAGTTMTLNTVNTIDNADIYVPPFDPGKTRSGNQEVSRREQTLALEFTRLGPVDTLEVYKTFSLDENYSRYGKLDWFAAGFDIPGYNEADDILDYFVRFASDERGDNYYEYRARLPRSSTPGRINWSEVSIALTELSNLKLNDDFPVIGTILYRAPGRTPGEQFVIKGRPSFTRLRRISFGLINLSGKEFSSGQLWFNELRATDVAKDRGRAQRVQVNGRMANLLNYNVMWNGTDANFQSVGQNRGSGNTDDNLALQTGVDIHRFFEGTKILLPFNYTYSRQTSSPRFTAGDDVVRTGALAEASDSRAMTRSMSLSYSRNWGDRSNPLMRYTLGGITANINRTHSERRSPSSVDSYTQMAAGVNYNIAPRQLLSLRVPGSRLRFYPLPERFYWNYSLGTNKGASYNRERDSLGTLVLRNLTDGRSAGIDFGMDSRPLDFFHHSFQARRNLTLPSELLETVGFINLGRVVNWNQNMDARFSLQRFGQWLRPNFSWRSSYGQNNGPELSKSLAVRAVQNQQSITLDWDLPFDRLAPVQATVAGDTLKRPGVAGWRKFLARLGPLQTDASFGTRSAHNLIVGTPDILYLVGLSRDPGFTADSVGGIKRMFGNRSTDALDWRVGGHTTFDIGLKTLVMARGDIQNTSDHNNGVENRSSRISFPQLDVTYGKVADVFQISRILTNPQLKTRYNRSQQVSYTNSAQPTSITTSSEWRPLIEVGGDLKNGTKTKLSIERRVSQTENRLLGNSISTERFTNVNFSVSRSYSKGQKVNILGKETTVKSSVNLGLSAAYELQDAETVDSRFAVPQNENKRDRISINANGGYWFSNNVTGNLDLGFGQQHDLIRDIVNRNLRVELRAQFTF